MDEYVGAEPMGTDGDDFSLMVDPTTGRLALVCPALMCEFEDIEHFIGWANDLLDFAKEIKDLDVFDCVQSEGAIDVDYAAEAIAAWQEEISEFLHLSRDDTGQTAPAPTQEDDLLDKKVD